MFAKKNGEEIYWIDFEYELFGDYFITDRILELEKVEEFNNSQQLSDLFSSENQYFEFLSDSRILEMLTVLLPDIKCKYEVGGFEIINWPYEIKERIYKDTFFNSLFLRNPKKLIVIYHIHIYLILIGFFFMITIDFIVYFM